MVFFTIGVYNQSEHDFFNKLVQNKIDTFLDIRNRRGVRGPLYSFANSIRLQSKLNVLEIRYEHIIELAPSTELILLQEIQDKKHHERRRERTKLSGTFISTYHQQILKGFDFTKFMIKLKTAGAEKIVLFCVEELPEACHRSLVAEKLKTMGYKIIHL